MLRRRRLRGWTSNQVWAPRPEYLEAGSRAPDPAAAGERPLIGAPDFHQITGFQHLLKAQVLVKLSSPCAQTVRVLRFSILHRFQEAGYCGLR